MFVCRQAVSVVVIIASAVASGPAFQPVAALEGNDALSGLPWDELKAAIDPSTTLVLDANATQYVEQCYPEFLKPVQDRSMHNLIDQPAGLCMNSLFCGFENCNPMAVVRQDGSAAGQQALGDMIFSMLTVNSDDPKVRDWLDTGNPSYSLPGSVLFPKSAGDVVAAVDFAAEHRIELSVKNSGHHYAGASTKRDTLLINMNQYRQYSPTGLEECGGTDASEPAQDLSNQPCLLATARGKGAALRVGGGENWDKVYRSVRAWNEAQPGGFKYHIVGGAAGTVSPMGWTWQGGLSGTAGGRLYGFGADQVLRIEAILPNGGRHVRFGPTAWEKSDGYQYPRTTAVTGACNENPSAQDESLWVWKTCPDDINFDDLWFAFNGGGGGTYGIVTSVHLQLHDYLPLKAIPFGGLSFAGCGVPLEDLALYQASWSFLIDFLHNPSSLNVSVEDSNGCGAPGGGGGLTFYCYGKGAGDAFMMAWRTFLAAQNETLIADAGVSAQSIEVAAACPELLHRNLTDYAQDVIITDDTGPLGHLVGKARDLHEPMLNAPGLGDNTYNTIIPVLGEFGIRVPNLTENAWVNLLIPTAWLLENKQEFARIMMTEAVLSPYFAFGGNAVTAQDQSNSVSAAYRGAGVQILFVFDPDLIHDLLPKMYDLTGTAFPAYVGTNHAPEYIRGPLKDDWTTPCPVVWTPAERNDKCVSLQDTMWGSDTVSRLEAIKEAIDPNYMLNCTSCIGNNRESADDTMSHAATKPAGGWWSVGAVLAAVTTLSNMLALCFF